MQDVSKEFRQCYNTIDKEEDLARHFNVRSVPTLVMIDEDKKEVKRVVGVQSVKQLNQFINE